MLTLTRILVKLPVESDEPVFKVKYAKRDKKIMVEIYISPKEKKHFVIGPLFEDFNILTLKKVKKAATVAIECEKKEKNIRWPSLFEQQLEPQRKQSCLVREQQLVCELPRFTDEEHSRLPNATPKSAPMVSKAAPQRPASPSSRPPQPKDADPQPSSPSCSLYTTPTDHSQQIRMTPANCQNQL